MTVNPMYKIRYVAWGKEHSVVEIVLLELKGDLTILEI